MFKYKMSEKENKYLDLLNRHMACWNSWIRSRPRLNFLTDQVSTLASKLKPTHYLTICIKGQLLKNNKHCRRVWNLKVCFKSFVSPQQLEETEIDCCDQDWVFMFIPPSLIMIFILHNIYSQRYYFVSRR